MWRVHHSGVVRAFTLLDDLSSPCRAEGLDCEVLALLHLGLIVVLHQEDRLAAMNLVGGDGVSAEVLNWFNCCRNVRTSVSIDRYAGKTLTR